MKTYFQLLQHPLWQKKRLEILQCASFLCEMCGDADRQLQIHHSYYERGLKPWEYPDESLHCLCEPCHKEAQRVMTELHRVIGTLALDEIECLLGLAADPFFYAGSCPRKRVCA